MKRVLYIILSVCLTALCTESVVYAGHSDSFISEYYEYVYDKTVIVISDDAEDFFVSEFDRLAADADSRVVASVDSGDYLCFAYDEDGNMLTGWCYCPKEFLDDFHNSTVSSDDVDEGAYIYFSYEGDALEFVEENPFSEPDCAYVTLKVNAVMPDEYKEWMTYTFVAYDNGRNICYSYELCDMFEGVRTFYVLLPVGDYSINLFADGVDYGTSLPTNVTVSTEYSAKGTVLLYNPTINDADVTRVEEDLGGTYDWIDSDAETETDETGDRKAKTSVVRSSGNDSESSDTPRVQNSDGAEENADILEEESETTENSKVVKALKKIKPVRAFNLVCAAILGTVLYYYFYYKPRKRRKKKLQGR